MACLQPMLSSKGFSMFDKNLSSRDTWFSQMEKLSIPFRTYKSFFPEQKELLNRTYDKLLAEKKPVWVFAAPPSSGKTHVICLLARVFFESGQKTAIVVPSNYLKEEFAKACLDIEGGLPETDILNLSEYLKSTEIYDFVLMDEAHNLKSFLELDDEYVKTVSFSLNEDFYQDLIGRYILPNKDFVAQQLSFPSAKDLLSNLRQIGKFGTKLNPVLSNPTCWTCFLYIWKNSNLCNVLFVQNDGVCNLKLPQKHILLFSATQLSTAELKFYCGLDENIIAPIETVKSSNQNEKQKYCLSVVDDLDFKSKLCFLKSILEESNVQTLVLFNNSLTCKKAIENLKQYCSNLFMVRSYSDDKNGSYQEYLNCTNGVLFTASTVFWEGITIKGLKLLIIFDPPFPRPRLFDLLRKKVESGHLDMSRRLRQGVGRVGRKKGEFGLSIVFCDVNMVGRSNLQALFSDVCILSKYSYQTTTIVHKIFKDKMQIANFFETQCNQAKNLR